jgi:AraC family transcriptional regulator
MDVKMEDRPAFLVAGMKYRGRNDHNEVPQLWESFVPRMATVRRAARGENSYGVMDNFDSDSGEFDYVAGVEVDSEVEQPEEMVTWKIPAQTYAVFRCTLPHIRDAFHQSYQEWLPGSGYRRAGGPEFELYTPEFRVDQTVYLYIPVESP